MPTIGRRTLTERVPQPRERGTAHEDRNRGLEAEYSGRGIAFRNRPHDARMEEEAGERAIVFSVGWSVILSIEACGEKIGHVRTEFFVGSGRVVCKSLV